MHVLCIFITAAFTGRDVLQSGRMFKPWISQLEEFIQGFEDVAVRGANEFSVSFSYKTSQGLLDVDLLVSPYWNHPRDFYQFLREVRKQERIK